MSGGRAAPRLARAARVLELDTCLKTSYAARLAALREARAAYMSLQACFWEFRLVAALGVVWSLAALFHGCQDRLAVFVLLLMPLVDTYLWCRYTRPYLLRAAKTLEAAEVKFARRNAVD